MNRTCLHENRRRVFKSRPQATMTPIFGGCHVCRAAVVLDLPKGEVDTCRFKSRPKATIISIFGSCHVCKAAPKH